MLSSKGCCFGVLRFRAFRLGVRAYRVCRLLHFSSSFERSRSLCSGCAWRAHVLACSSFQLCRVQVKAIRCFSVWDFGDPSSEHVATLGRFPTQSLRSFDDLHLVVMELLPSSFRSAALPMNFSADELLPRPDTSFRPQSADLSSGCSNSRCAAWAMKPRHYRTTGDYIRRAPKCNLLILLAG